MFKIVIVVSAIVVAVLAETNFVPRPFGREARDFKIGDEISRPQSGNSVGTYDVPIDIGGNYGDNLWRERVAGDVLLSSEIQINNIANVEQQFEWNSNFPGKYISHIRFLNIGRERAYVEIIRSNGGPTADAVIRLAANLQFRLLIEVYGR